MKKLIILFAFIALSVALFSQDDKSYEFDNYSAERVYFIAEGLNLVAPGAGFWVPMLAYKKLFPMAPANIKQLIDTQINEFAFKLEEVNTKLRAAELRSNIFMVIGCIVGVLFVGTLTYLAIHYGFEHKSLDFAFPI